jgi:hypothetical protein
MKRFIMSVMLMGLPWALRIAARRNPAFRERLKEKDLSAVIKLEDGSVARYYRFTNGRIRSGSGDIASPDVTMTFRDADLAVNLMMPPRNYLDMINAMKNFQVGLYGEEEMTSWFSEILTVMFQVGWKYGTELGDGVTRYTSNTNGGPVFVYVKDDKIIRITPIEFDDSDDAASWTIKPEAKRVHPAAQTTVSPYTLAWKSMVYSKDRVLYPMKRVDFDPNGERNPQNRGTSGYERISWDEALDIVASEIKRVKREHGPGAILNSSGSHHTWGNLGYWLSARLTIFQLHRHDLRHRTTRIAGRAGIGEPCTTGAAQHAFGRDRTTYGTVEDMLKECEMVVFWSSDPEATSGVYGAFEGTVRRQWLKELGIKMVHIDPFYNHTAALHGRQVARSAPGHRQCPGPGHRLCLDHRRSLRQGLRGRRTHGGL